MGEQRYRSTLSLTSVLQGGWVVNATPRPLYPRERPGTHCIEGWWAPGLVWTGSVNLAPTGIRSPDRPANSDSLYRLHYPGSRKENVVLLICVNIAECTIQNINNTGNERIT